MLIKVAQASRLLGISISTIERAIKAGAIPNEQRESEPIASGRRGPRHWLIDLHATREYFAGRGILGRLPGPETDAAIIQDLLDEITRLKQRITDLMKQVPPPPRAHPLEPTSPLPATTPRLREKRHHRSVPGALQDYEPLPEGWISLHAFAEKEHVPETTWRRAARQGDFRYQMGRWQSSSDLGRKVFCYAALDPQQQEDFKRWDANRIKLA